MNVSAIVSKDYGDYEYLLVIQPHEELCSRIHAIKIEFNEKYKIMHSATPKPSITIAAFRQIKRIEERIINRLDIIAKGFKPFRIELKDYGNFPSHTIFINVSSRLPVQKLVKRIREDAQRLLKLDAENKPHFIMEPCIIIARKLQPWQYEKGWLEYSHRHFTSRFMAERMLLLRRQSGKLKYSPIHRFEFMNLPVSIKQCDLFS